jgi:hypothetical protein
MELVSGNPYITVIYLHFIGDIFCEEPMYNGQTQGAHSDKSGCCPNARRTENRAQRTKWM